MNRSGRWSRLAAGLLALLATATASGTAQDRPPVLDDFANVLPQLQPEARARLQRHAGQWAGWSEARREQFRQSAAQWEALSPAERDARRERHAAWQAMPASERRQVAAAAAAYATLPADQQQALRSEFDALDRSERRGWMLGPALGADYSALQPLLAQVPEAEHKALLAVLRQLTPVQRRDLAVLVQRTPPQERARVRSELVSTAASNRDDWLWDRLHR
ncbi:MULTISPECIES: DUF3106 domain-containing protein [unclassified Lysobacter]